MPHYLYTYLPKSVDVKKDGLRSIATLDGDEWKKYVGRAGSNKKEDVVAWLEHTFQGRTRAFSCFTHPIPDDADPAILKFRNAKQLVILPSYEELKRLGLVEACWKTNIGKRGCTQVEGPDYNEEMNWIPHDPKLLFTHTNHYIIVMKNGIIPGKYCTVVKNQSNEDLSAEALAEKVIRDGFLYHGSPYSFSVLKPQPMRDVDGKRALSLSPFKGIASMFIIPFEDLKKGYKNCMFGCREWFSSPEDKYRPLSQVHIYHNIKQRGHFEKIYTGYLYTVSAEEVLKDSSDNPRWKVNKEVLTYVPEVHPVKVEKIQIKMIADYDVARSGAKHDAIPDTPSSESIVATNVRNNLVYHGSPRKLDKLAASASTTADAQDSVCVTPCKALAYCFAIDKDAVLTAVEKQFARRVLKCNFGYDIWNKPVSELYKVPKNITIELNIRGIKPIHGKSVGYIYTVDFNKYKDKCHMYHNSDVEIAIKGDVDYIKREKVEVNWTCVSSELAIKHHGEGQLGTSDLGRESGEALMIHKWSMDEIFIHKASDITDEQWKLITESVNLAAKASGDEAWTEAEVKNKILKNKLEVYFFLQHKYEASKTDRSFTETYHPLGAIQFNPKTMFITNFAIFKKAQGQGVGFLALKKFMTYIKSRYPNKDIYINVASSNKAAKALYKKVGFTELSEENGACKMVYKLGHEGMSTEALRRTWTIDDIKSIDDLKQFYKTCRYSIIDWKANECWADTHKKDFTDEEWEQNWKLLTPEQVVKYRCGVCYDTAMMTKYFLDKWRIPNKFLFSYTKRSRSDDYNNDPTHTFVIYKENNVWKWLEGSWGPFKNNNWSESDPSNLIRNITKALANEEGHTHYTALISRFPKYGVKMDEFYHFLKKQIYNPQFEIDPDPKYAGESFMSEYATISFPKEEIPTISKQSRIITTRVSADYDKYHKGDVVKTPWDKVYKVTNRVEITNVKDHPYYSELTKDQIKFLSKYDKIAVLTLTLQEDATEEYYYGMNNEYIPDSEEVGIEMLTIQNVSMEENVVQEQGTYVIIRGFPVAAFFKQLSKHYQTHKLENLIQVVHSIGISQWTVNTRTVKIHRFFLPEIVYLLNKFGMSQTLIGDIQRGSWMGAPITDHTDCKYDRITANMNCTLMDHQKKFVENYADLKDYHRLRGYLLSFGQGLGKTITAIALMEALGKERVVVICPKNTMVETWKSHFQRFYKKEQSVYVAGVDKEFTGQRFCVFNYDAIDKLNNLAGVKTAKMGIIVDESHNFLRMQSARTRKLIDLAKSSEDADVLLVSGTPIKTSGLEMIPLISILDPLFDDDAMKIFKDSFGVNTKIAAEVLNARLKRMMERVTKDVLDLPPKRRSVIKVKLPDGYKYTIKEVKKGMKFYIEERMKFHRDHMIEYRQEFDECMRYLNSQPIAQTEDFKRYRDIISKLVRTGGRFDQGDEDVAWANAYEKAVVEKVFPSELLHKFRHCKAAIKYLHLKVRGEVLGQYIAKLRIEMTTEMLKAVNIKQLIDEAEKKTIIFTSYIETIETCEKHVKALGYKPIVIYGKNSGEIAPLAAKFQKDQSYNPLIASLQTLSTGATLTAANRVIFLNKPWRSIDYEQASDRVHRIGQDTAVDIISLVLDTGEEGNLSTRMEDIMDASARAFDAIVEEHKKEADKELRAANEDYIFDIEDLPDDVIDESNISFEGMQLLHDTTEQRVLNRLAKPHYRPKGANSWEHIQQDMANGILLIKEVRHRELTLQEYATVLWHDSACKSMYPEKIGHGAKGAAIAKRDLKKTGYFTDKELEEIYNAICEHDETSNPKNLHSSDLSDFLASADFNPLDIPWMLNKSYAWGIRHGKTHEQCIENVCTHMPKTYGSKGVIVYPKLYTAYHKSRIKKLQHFFDHMTKEQCEQIIADYRKKHRLTPRDFRLPDPDAESTTLGFDDDKYTTEVYSAESLDVSLEAIPAKYSKLVFEDTPIKKKVYSICKPYYSDTGSHGYEHIKEVLATAYVLKGKKSLTDAEYTAILFHDTGRKITDEGHSVESERIAKRELPKLKYFSDEELEDIYKAILYHSTSWRKTHHITEMSPLADLVANADKGFPRVSYYDICLRPALWILEGHDKGNEKWKRLNQYRTLDDIAQGVMETLDEYTKKYYDPNEKSLYARVFAKEKKKQIELKNNITIDIIKKTVVTIMKEYGYSLSGMESLEPSMEAANIKAKRKKVQDYILNAMKLLDPHTDTNVKYWKQKFDSMNDKDFDNFMHYLREGKTNIHMFVPPFKVTLQTREMLDAAHKLGVKIMHRIWMNDPHTGIKYLTPEEYMVLQLPVRRQQQFLDEKMSVPDNDKTIDGLTGQVTGDSKSCSITNPEIQILHARNLDATLYEFSNVRGGNIRNYAEFKRSLEETGAVKLEQLDPTNRTRVAVMGQVLLTAMHLDVNLVDI